MFIPIKHIFLNIIFILFLLPAAGASAFQDDEDTEESGTAIEELLEEEWLVEPDEDAVPLTHTPESNYEKENIQIKRINENDWENITREMNYLEKPEKQKKKEEKKQEKKKEDKPSKDFDFAGLEQFIKVISYIIAIVLIVLVMAKVFNLNIFGRNKRFETRETLTIEQLEEALHESDVEKFLREALERKEFKLAIRVYYLQILKELSEKNFIRWKKDKTNREYMYEMNGRNNASAFREVTSIFEKAWYGNTIIGENEYQAISPYFKNFIDHLRREAA
ncbi:MAG: DUF4129 domain-containing protein [Cytophagaceae bacterium]